MGRRDLWPVVWGTLEARRSGDYRFVSDSDGLDGWALVLVPEIFWAFVVI
jgi:predicted lipoprotein with Yx(FWY)xxD motif